MLTLSSVIEDYIVDRSNVNLTSYISEKCDDINKSNIDAELQSMIEYLEGDCSV